ncbi:hypothetical protein D3C71_1846190 [compost metagenome]
MGNAADVPELREDHPAIGMHSIRDGAPALDLRLGVDARCPGVTLAPRFNLRPFADHESRRGALAVIHRHQVGRHITGLGTALTSQRWEGDAIFQREATQLNRGKQRLMVHGDDS